MSLRPEKVLLPAMLLCVAAGAHAHEATGVAGGFTSGFVHPLLGLDHVAARVEHRHLGRRVERDLREEKAAPYFEEYLERLRQRYADRVEVDEEALRAFIADKRRAEAPVDM